MSIGNPPETEGGYELIGDYYYQIEEQKPKSGRKLDFEHEELLDNDSSTDEEEDLPDLDVAEIVFLNKQLQLVNARHAHLQSIRKRAEHAARRSLKVINRVKAKSIRLEEQSWSISCLLGRTERSDFIGL